jgi:hypothetical protein
MQVVWRRYLDLNHSAPVNASLADGLPFARTLLAGQHVASTCDPTFGAAPLRASAGLLRASGGAGGCLSFRE